MRLRNLATKSLISPRNIEFPSPPLDGCPNSHCLLTRNVVNCMGFMDKRYQVFVSSTYADLKQERQRVIQALMEMDCIPAGMELFPAADDEQWAFIKRIIDDCDYYLIIIGGRYGSLTPEGISYTEKEFNYALERGLKIIALLHEEPDSIPVNKSDIDPVLR